MTMRMSIFFICKIFPLILKGAKTVCFIVMTWPFRNSIIFILLYMVGENRDKDDIVGGTAFVSSGCGILIHSKIYMT